MIHLSFRRQLQILYSRAGYKTTGMSLPCTSEVQPSAPHQRLTYKIDIAHRLYREYERQNFKFSEKGVTPRMLAEEIAVYTHESDHCQMEIDSFGNVLVSPTEAYLCQMKISLIQAEVAQHYPIKVRHLQAQVPASNPNQKQSCLLNLEDLSLSSLRILFYLEMLIRKRVLLQECPASNMTRLIDISKLSSGEIETLLELQIIGFTGSNIQVKAEGQGSTVGRNLNVVDRFQSQDIGSCLGGCLRHKFIQFCKKNKALFCNQNQILKFGQIFPDIPISKLRNLYPLTYKLEILKVLKHSLNFDPIMPISLRQTTAFPAIPSSRLPQLLKNRRALEQVLLLMDALGDDQVVNCYHYLKARRSQLTEEKPLLDKIAKTIQLIIG